MIKRVSMASLAFLALAAAAELPTPMAERVVTFAALNKASREVRTLTAKPGSTVVFERLTIRVRACETTPPWERPLTGAFLQIDERLRQGGSKRIFSGWLYAESPSLNSVQNSNYDVWVKSCTMSFPETGPDTVGGGQSASVATDEAKASSAPKSAEQDSADDNRAR